MINYFNNSMFLKHSFCLIFYFLILKIVTAQQSNYYFVEDNSLKEAYKNNKIKTCKVYSKDIDRKIFNFRYLTEQLTVDTSGNILNTIEYFDRDKTTGWVDNFYYNQKNLLSYYEWNWIGEKKWEKSTYIYNENGCIISVCKFHKTNLDAEYTIDSCNNIFYTTGKIDFVLNDKNDTIQYYIHKKDSTFLYSNKSKLLKIFYNGLLVKRFDERGDIIFEYNNLGQLVKSIGLGNKSTLRTTFSFEYKNGLLKYVTGSYYYNGKTFLKEKYKYKKHKKKRG